MSMTSSDFHLPAQERVVARFRGFEATKKQVRFLLGTDEFIEQEARVALTPRHVARLAHDLAELGIEVEICVVAGAGDRARPAFTDQQYRDAGATVVTLEEVAGLPAFDLLHALKEPTEYEAELAGPLLRLGALHLASKPPGLCRMLQTKNFAGILDGATVGSCSYLLEQGDRTPIVGSMSRFAGSVSGRKVVEALDARGIGPGRVVIVGGGIAGKSAISKVKPKAAELIVIEPWQPARQRLDAFLRSEGFSNFQVHETLTDDVFDDAVGIVFAHRSGAKAAEKVCDYDQIMRMREGAAIADIAIDQGGAIRHDGYVDTDDAAMARSKYIDLFGDRFFYYAEVNMPREEPHEASEQHGDSSLPYVTALLLLCAQHGSPEAVAQQLLATEIRHYSQSDDASELSYLEAISQDLRNGIQLAVREGAAEITDPDISRNDVLRSWIEGCAE